MILGIGVDRIEIERVHRAWRRHGERFHRRVFTDGEWDYCLSRPEPAPSLAARFAAKEAVMKALGWGWGGGVHFRQIEVVRAPTGAPSIRLHHGADDCFRSRGAGHVLVSLTHDRTHALAFVVIERG